MMKMSQADYDILRELLQNTDATQRELAGLTSYSLGKVNKCLKDLTSAGYIDVDRHPTDKTYRFVEEQKPRHAVILAAGFGLRLIPFNYDKPKGLLEVEGETLVERLIKQLHEVEVRDITIVVGHLKESYEFLIDLYGVHLLTNREYASKNNLHSLKLALSKMSNSYIVPCDVWCEDNPFSQIEFYPWYAMGDSLSGESHLRANRQGELVEIQSPNTGQTMIGIAYLTRNELSHFSEKLIQLASHPKYDQSFWETALWHDKKLTIYAKFIETDKYFEINTMDDYKRANENPHHELIEIQHVISELMDVPENEITKIQRLKAGMTNNSWQFTVDEQDYILRVPGEGTDLLINRRQEYAVYQALLATGLSISDDLLYFDPVHGYKITRKFRNARNCDPHNKEELVRSMRLLRKLHELNLSVDHEFDLFEKIEFYEKLRGDTPSVYRDYEKTKETVYRLKLFLEANEEPYTMCHIDAVADNFLFFQQEEGAEEDVRLIDWEYAAMQDPLVDIGMFSVYSNLDESSIRQLLDMYYEGNSTSLLRLRLYAYVAVIGLLWSNWCEFKRLQGVDFGQYSLNQYRFAKEYSRLVLANQSFQGFPLSNE